MENQVGTNPHVTGTSHQDRSREESPTPYQANYLLMRSLTNTSMGPKAKEESSVIERQATTKVVDFIQEFDSTRDESTVQFRKHSDATEEQPLDHFKSRKPARISCLSFESEVFVITSKESVRDAD